MITQSRKVYLLTYDVIVEHVMLGASSYVQSLSLGHHQVSATPTSWNQLPISLRTAQSLSVINSQLKTKLFKFHCFLP